MKIVAEYFHIDSYFDEMVGSEPEGRRTNKTEVIEETLKRLGFSEHRDQVIMVGDREHDISRSQTMRDPVCGCILRIWKQRRTGKGTASSDRSFRR